MKRDPYPQPIVLRWHLSRIDEDDPDDVQATIAPGQKNVRSLIAQSGLASFAQQDQDRIQWWSPNEKKQIEGSVDAKLLMNAVRDNNALQIESPPDPDQRRLVEEMVLLQSFAATDDAESQLSELQRAEFADLSELAYAPDAVWLDFTRQARAMSKSMYAQVLGESD